MAQRHTWHIRPMPSGIDLGSSRLIKWFAFTSLYKRMKWRRYECTLRIDIYKTQLLFFKFKKLLLGFRSFCKRTKLLLDSYDLSIYLFRNYQIKMGRSPCCDKNGVKKGPRTSEEDQKLIDYIRFHGPGNWRILPKNAGKYI